VFGKRREDEVMMEYEVDGSPAYLLSRPEFDESRELLENYCSENIKNISENNWYAILIAKHGTISCD